MDPPRIAADAAPAGPRYRFADVAVDEGAHTAFRDGKPLALEPKTFAVLLVLLRHPGQLLERDQLLDAVWGHRHVTPGVLTRAIAQLRHALGDDPHRPRYIQTQHALGYRFIGQLLDPHEAPEGAARPATGGPVPDAAARPLQPVSAPKTEGDAGPSAPTTQIAAPVPQTTAAEAASDAAPSTALHVAGLGSGPDPAVETRPRHPAAPSTGAGGGNAMRLAVTALLVLVLVLGWLGWGARQPSGMAPAGKALPKLLAQQAADPPHASIAVLPFTSLSADRSDAYLARGLAEEMQDTLAGVPGLYVAAQPTTANATSPPTDVKTLGVATVLDASVRREGRRVRIHARLIDAQTGYTLWSDSYDRETDDVFALQTEIATEVVRALVGVLRPGKPAVGPDVPDGIACSLKPVGGRVYIDVDYGADSLPSATPDQCEVEIGSTITWRGPPREAAEFSVIFADDSPQGPGDSRVLGSETVGGREKITMTAGNTPGIYKYDVEAYGRRAERVIVIR